MDLFVSNVQLFVGIAVGLVIAFPLLVGMHLFHSRAGAKKIREIDAQKATVAKRDARIAELEPLVHVDTLTGIGNRRKFDDVLAIKVSHAIRGGGPLTVLLIDVNDFKVPNDKYGHPFGDKILRRVAESIDEAIRTTDTVCRIGGDEFAVILVDCDLAEGMAAILRVTQRLSTNSLLQDNDVVPLFVSIGGACLSVENDRVSVAEKYVGAPKDLDVKERIRQMLYKEADRRLFIAKSRKSTEQFPVEIS